MKELRTTISHLILFNLKGPPFIIMLIAHDIWPGNPGSAVIREVRDGEWSRGAQGEWRVHGKQMMELLGLLVPGKGREGLERFATQSAVGECSYT